MASYNIQWRSSTKKDLRKIPTRDVERIVSDVEALAKKDLSDAPVFLRPNRLQATAGAPPCGESDIQPLFYAMDMMVPVMCRPPNRAALNRRSAQHAKDELPDARGLEGAM